MAHTRGARYETRYTDFRRLYHDIFSQFQREIMRMYVPGRNERGADWNYLFGGSDLLTPMLHNANVYGRLGIELTRGRRVLLERANGAQRSRRIVVASETKIRRLDELLK